MAFLGGALGRYFRGWTVPGAMFGGRRDEYGGDIDEAQRYYQQEIERAQQELGQQQAAGQAGYAPYAQAGQAALGAYEGGLGLGGATAEEAARRSFRESPGYQFALGQGMQAQQRAAAAGGTTGTPAEQKAMMRYGQGLAGQEYGQYQQRLGGLAGMGEQVAGQQAQLGLGYGQLGAGLYGQLGQAGAESALARAMLRQREEQGRRDFWGRLFGAGIGAAGKAFL